MGVTTGEPSGKGTRVGTLVVDIMSHPICWNTSIELKIEKHPPLHGEHIEKLGVQKEAIDQLKEEGVI